MLNGPRKVDVMLPAEAKRADIMAEIIEAATGDDHIAAPPEGVVLEVPVEVEVPVVVEAVEVEVEAEHHEREGERVLLHEGLTEAVEAVGTEVVEVDPGVKVGVGVKANLQLNLELNREINFNKISKTSV